MTNVPRYDIFSGRRERDAVWIELVEGLGSANARLKQLAAERRGPYFVFSTETGTVVASIDTTNRDDAEVVLA
jgi:hypothetical protein